MGSPQDTIPRTAAPKKRLGDRLVDRGFITDTQLQLALAEQKRTGEPVGQVLKSLGFVREEDLESVLAEDLGVPFVRLADEVIDRNARAKLDVEWLTEKAVMPLREEKGIVVVAMARPSDVEVLDALQKKLNKPLKVLAATPSDIRGNLKATASDAEVVEPLMADAGNATRQVDRILGRAVREGATDIHIEPEEKLYRIRFRVDGMLRPVDTLTLESGQSVVARIKVLAGLDIAEHRKPQDGRFQAEVAGGRIDLRTSTMPTRNGENVVLRILDRSAGLIRLDKLGLSEQNLKKLREIADLPHGLFFVTGPTGSGKTTTLYAILTSIDALSKKVCSVEDPIEADLPLIRQSQVDPAGGFDFADGLRALLRQDPDVILVGEVRDRETAEIAMRASLTGHFVLATLHTNDAPSAPSRILDMGIEPFLLNSSLSGVLAQRLVRTVCRNCREEVEPGPADREVFGDRLPDRVVVGRGCDQCGKSGYRGRLGIHELLVPDDEIRRVIATDCNTDRLREVAIERGFRTMLEDGADKALLGLTTAAEILRVSKAH